MRKPTTAQGRLLIEMHEGRLLMKLWTSDRDAYRYTINTWPASKRTVESCIRHGWIDVLSGRFGDPFNRCQLSHAGLEAITP